MRGARDFFISPQATTITCQRAGRSPKHDGRPLDLGGLMQTEFGEARHTDLPPALVYPTAVVCGVLAALAVQILLGRAGIELAGVWSTLFSSSSLQLRSAGTWWLMVGAAFLVSAVVAAALSRLPWPWHRFRLVRWLLAAALVLAIAEIGHSAATNSQPSMRMHVAVSFMALLAAALMALFGAFFASKR
jgi:hypothetical protein